MSLLTSAYPLALTFSLHIPTEDVTLDDSPLLFWARQRKNKVISQKSSFPKGGYSLQEMRLNKSSQYSRWRDEEAYMVFRLPWEDLCSRHGCFERLYPKQIFSSLSSNVHHWFQHNPKIYLNLDFISVLILLNLWPLTLCNFCLLFHTWQKSIIFKLPWRTKECKAKWGMQF